MLREKLWRGRGALAMVARAPHRDREDRPEGQSPLDYDAREDAVAMLAMMHIFEETCEDVTQITASASKLVR